MSKQCPSCSESYRYLLKCQDCGHEFCNYCSDQKFVIVPVLFSKYDPGPGLRSACPDCGSDDYEVISEDDEGESSESHATSDSDDANERTGSSASSFRGGNSSGSSESSSYYNYSSSDTSSNSSGGLGATLIVIGIVAVIIVAMAGQHRQGVQIAHVEQAVTAPQQSPPSDTNQPSTPTQDQTLPPQSQASLPVPSPGPWRRTTDCETVEGTYQCRWCPDPNYPNPIAAGCYFRPADGDMNAEAAAGFAPSNMPPVQPQGAALPSVTPGPWTRSDCETVDGAYQCRWCPNPQYTRSFGRPCYMRPAEEDMNVTVGDNVPQ